MVASLRKRTRAINPISTGSESDDDVCCEECGSGHSPAELLLCDGCNKGYHLFCLRPILVSVPKGSWFGPCCSKLNKPKSFPLIQTKIVEFFKIQRHIESSEKLSQDSRKRRRRVSGLVVSKKKRRMLAYSPSEDPAVRLKQMVSLATALTATGTEFSNELSYGPGMAPRAANCPDYEQGGMQVSSKEDFETLQLCKSMMERGECPPLMVVFDRQEGFTVEADKPIKDWTIITEYAGDVDYLKNRENDDGDSIMTLLSAADPLKTLVICPDKFGNIARYINGINNHTREGRKKQNLKCVRFDVNGESRVLPMLHRHSNMASCPCRVRVGHTILVGHPNFPCPT